MQDRAPNGWPPPDLAGNWKATLTVLTGIQAGQVLVLDGSPITIGRAADAGLVVDDPGVSDHHARVAQTAGTFYVEDLASTNGTFLGTNPVGIALLHGGDVLRLGPNALLRFAIIDSSEKSL